MFEGVRYRAAWNCAAAEIDKRTMMRLASHLEAQGKLRIVSATVLTLSGLQVPRHPKRRQRTRWVDGVTGVLEREGCVRGPGADVVMERDTSSQCRS